MIEPRRALFIAHHFDINLSIEVNEEVRYLTWNGSTDSRYDFQYGWAWWILEAQLPRQDAVENRYRYLYIIACNENNQKFTN